MLSPIKVWKGEKVKLFSGISTEISAQCNRSCVFCPNHDHTRPDQQLPTDVIKSVFEQLADLNYSGRWQPYMYNEPLRDERFIKLVKIARRMVPRMIINVSTNCDYLNEEILDEMIDAGVNQLSCNIYSARDGSSNDEKVQKGIEIAKKRAKLVQSWLDARPHISQVGSLYTGGHPKKIIARVQHKYGVTQDGDSFGGSFKLANRSNNVEWLKTDPKATYAGVCTSPFRILEINWRGDALLCCHDYLGLKSYGNIKNTPIVEIWNHIELNKKREELQQGIRKGKLCGVCDYGGGAYKHMIHPVQLERRKA